MEHSDALYVIALAFLKLWTNLWCAKGDGPDWTSFSGEIVINDNVKLGGFKASGLSVKVCVFPPFYIFQLTLGQGLHRLNDVSA